MKYYLLHIYGDVEPILHGPYKTTASRDRRARTVRHADPGLRDGLYRIDSKCAVTVNSYSGAELDVERIDELDRWLTEHKPKKEKGA